MKQLTTKQDLIRNIHMQFGPAGYISWGQIAKYRGVSKNNLKERERTTHGLRYIEDGRGKKYRVVDVAERLQQMESIEVQRCKS